MTKICLDDVDTLEIEEDCVVLKTTNGEEVVVFNRDKTSVEILKALIVSNQILLNEVKFLHEHLEHK